MGDLPPDFESIQPKVEINLSGLCFICLNGTNSPGNVLRSDLTTSYKDLRKVKERDKKKLKCAVKILTSYILQHSFPSSKENQDREELQTSILSCFSEENLSICSECLSKAENLVELHLELEKIRMQILNVLKSLQDYLTSSWGKNVNVEEAGIQDNAMIYQFQEALIQEFMSGKLSNEIMVRLTTTTATTTPAIVPDTGSSSSTSKVSSNDVHVDPLESCNIEMKEDEEDIKPELDPDRVGEDCEDVLGGNSNELGDEDYSFLDDEASSLSDHDEDNQEDVDVDVEASAMLTSPNSPFKCQICLKTFKLKNTLRMHMKCVHSSKLHSCASCPKQYKSEMALRRHEKIHLEDFQLPCPHCSETFKSNYLLRKHITVVHGLREALQCQFCPKIFSEMYLLKRHEKDAHEKKKEDKELERKRFQCPECPFEGKLHSSLMKHRRSIHGEKKMFKCQFCDDQFKSKLSLENHERLTHTQESSFICQVEGCEMAFITQFLRTAHERNVHDFPEIKVNEHGKRLYACNLCQRDFTQLHSLWCHLKNLHGIGGNQDIVNCPQCSKTVRKRGLEKHIARVHEKVGEGYQ